MRLVIHQISDDAPYAGSYVRLHAHDGEAVQVALGLVDSLDGERALGTLARLLGLTLALGEPRGGAPIRQLWIDPSGAVVGKMGMELASATAGESERLERRIRTEWDRFLASALARLRGEPRGSAHFRYPAGAWEAERPAVEVTAWPPLAGEALPPLH